jgi:hypothetical protein
VLNAQASLLENWVTGPIICLGVLHGTRAAGANIVVFLDRLRRPGHWLPYDCQPELPDGAAGYEGLQHLKRVDALPRS